MTDTWGPFSLDEKIVVVTGGTRRYGYYFCQALSQAGATVVLTSRDQGRADETAREISQQGSEVHGYSLELEDSGSIDRFVDAVVADHGGIDVLVNNARTMAGMTTSEITQQELDRLFRVNVVGTFLLTRRVVEEMKQASGGNIINIGSIYGLVGQQPRIYADPEASLSYTYCIFKGGMVTYSRQLATTLAEHNIRANCLSLGGLRETSVDESHFLPHYEERVPLGRMAIGEDVAGPIVFLASDASAYVTGTNLVVDGGWTAW